MSMALFSESEGKVDFKVGEEIYQTWYKIYGDLKKAHHCPIIVLHGGPGLTHHYMVAYKELYLQAGIPVILYDQLGNGQSSHCPDVPEQFWTSELLMDQLDNLLVNLEIYDNFDLLGHSWGGMLAAQYTSTRSPKGLQHLIISNAPSSIPLHMKGVNTLLTQLFPSEYVSMIRKHEREGTTKSEEYQEACMRFLGKHFCTVNPWPDELMESIMAASGNDTVHDVMSGPCEFDVTGTLKTWDITPIIHKITSPTLLISCTMDCVQEIAYRPYLTQIPNVKWVDLEKGTHMVMYEDPERYFETILDFLKGPDSATA